MTQQGAAATGTGPLRTLCKCTAALLSGARPGTLTPLFCELNPHEHGACPEIAEAARFWLVRVLDHGGARLYYADEASGHLSAQREAGGAADSLLVASILADDPAHRVALRRLARQLLAALDVTGHPNGAELAAISSGAAAIRTAVWSAGAYR